MDFYVTARPEVGHGCFVVLLKSHPDLEKEVERRKRKRKKRKKMKKKKEKEEVEEKKEEKEEKER